MLFASISKLNKHFQTDHKESIDRFICTKSGKALFGKSKHDDHKCLVFQDVKSELIRPAQDAATDIGHTYVTKIEPLSLQGEIKKELPFPESVSDRVNVEPLISKQIKQDQSETFQVLDVGSSEKKKYGQIRK